MAGACNVSLNVLLGKSSAQTLHPGKRINPQKAEYRQSTYIKHSHTCNHHLFPWASSVWSKIAIQYSHDHWSIESVIATFRSLSNSDLWIYGELPTIQEHYYLLWKLVWCLEPTLGFRKKTLKSRGQKTRASILACPVTEPVSLR